MRVRNAHFLCHSCTVLHDVAIFPREASDGSIRSDATLNAVPIADTRRSGALGSIRTTRAVSCGMANGWARRMPNAWVFSSAATVPSPTSTACFASASGTWTNNGWEQPTRSDGERLH
jgi:hypothetical protein